VTNLLEELKDLSRKNGEITIEKEQAQDKLSVVENEVSFYFDRPYIQTPFSP
jgi:hypothetical protein